MKGFASVYRALCFPAPFLAPFCTGVSIPCVRVRVLDIEPDTAAVAVTNNTGPLYTFQPVHPGCYSIEGEAQGFKVMNWFGFRIDYRLRQSRPAVSTIVDRQFVENMPLNGRSVQSGLRPSRAHAQHLFREWTIQRQRGSARNTCNT